MKIHYSIGEVRSMKEDKIYWKLFVTFLKIGAFTFGGGYAMIPMIQKEIVDKNHWIENKDILDITAIAESTPGPIAVNSATFVGNKIAGFWGAFFATLGVVIPSFVIIYCISFVLQQFENLQVVKYAFVGVRACVLALIIQACYSMYKQCERNLFAYVLIVFSFVSVAVFSLNVLYVILIDAVCGIGYIYWKGEKA